MGETGALKRAWLVAFAAMLLALFSAACPQVAVAYSPMQAASAGDELEYALVASDNGGWERRDYLYLHGYDDLVSVIKAYGMDRVGLAVVGCSEKGGGKHRCSYVVRS